MECGDKNNFIPFLQLIVKLALIKIMTIRVTKSSFDKLKIKIQTTNSQSALLMRTKIPGLL